MQDERILQILERLLKTTPSAAAIARLIYPERSDFVPVDHLSFLEQLSGSRLDSYYIDKPSYGSSRDSRRIHSFTDVESREAHIHNRLGHISVNPNDPYNTNALVNSYRFVDDDPLSSNIKLQTSILKGEVKPAIDQDETRDICVNKNFSACKEFVDSLIRLADQQYALSQAQFARQDKVLTMQRALLLHGQRGAGKTFFENYILSRFSDYLDGHNTVWVRINLVEDIGYDDNLVNWIGAQTAKIVMRYYDPKSQYFPPSRKLIVDVDEYVSKHLYQGKRGEERKGLKRRYEHACTIFRQAGHHTSNLREEPISDQLMPPEIAVQVTAAARAAGFRFIVVLDGLDILEITKAYRQRFNKLTQQSMELAKNTKANGYALLVVTRTSTLHTHLRAEHQSTYDQASFERYIIRDVPLAKIVESRLRYIVSEIRLINRRGDIGWLTDDLDSHIDEYNAFLHLPERLYGGPAKEPFINILQQVQGSNNRAKMQMLQYRYYDFFARRKTVRVQYHAYQLVEALMKAGHRFPPIPYKYSIHDGEQVRTNWHAQRYDSRFFPSVFRFPFNSTGRPRSKQSVAFESGLERPRLENVLLGLRALQLIDAHDAYSRRKQRVVSGGVILDRVTVGDLARTLHRYFGYEEGLSYRIIDELVEYQLIEYHHPNLSVASNRQEDNELVPLPKLGFLLNRFMNDLAYLNMSAIRVPLPPSAFSVARNERPYFHAVSYEEPKDSLPLWVAAKLCNAAGLIRLIRWINERQEAEVKARINEFQRIDHDWCAILTTAVERGLHAFLVETERNVFRESQLALAGVQLPLASPFIFEYLRAYENTWGRS